MSWRSSAAVTIDQRAGSPDRRVVVFSKWQDAPPSSKDDLRAYFDFATEAVRGEPEFLQHLIRRMRESWRV
jgi:hypothetical protein